MKRFKSSNASIGERLAALSVAGIMKGKLKLGMGLNDNKCLQIFKKIKQNAQLIIDIIDNTTTTTSNKNTSTKIEKKITSTKTEKKKSTAKPRQQRPKQIKQVIKKVNKKKVEQNVENDNYYNDDNDVELMEIDPINNNNFMNTPNNEIHQFDRKRKRNSFEDSITVDLETKRKRKNNSATKLNLDEPIIYTPAALKIMEKMKNKKRKNEDNLEDSDINSEKRLKID